MNNNKLQAKRRKAKKRNKLQAAYRNRRQTITNHLLAGGGAIMIDIDKLKREAFEKTCAQLGMKLEITSTGYRVGGIDFSISDLLPDDWWDINIPELKIVDALNAQEVQQ